MKVPFYLHNIGEEEIRKVSEVLKTPFLTAGPVTGEFEKKLSEYLQVKYAVGISNCTMGLFLALKALGIGPGDEVITTPMSFIATANTILHVGAQPVFVDVEPETGNINAEQIEKAITPATRAIMPVHLYGHLVDMKKIRSLADKHNLFIIEDAAHALESQRDGVRTGQLGTVAALSFYATKNITSGEGGALVTNDEKLADTFKKMRLHGMSKNAADRYTAKHYQHYDMELLGYKCNMKDMEAALLIPQLEKADERLKRREAICQAFEKGFAGLKNLSFPKVLPGNKSARHLFTIWAQPEQRDEVMFKLQEKEIGVAVNYRAIHLMQYYRDTFGYERGMFPEAERIGDGTITLPLYIKLTDEQVQYVIDSVRQAVE